VDEDEARRTSWREVEIAVQYDRARPGYPPEAVAFALLAHLSLEGKAGNLPQVTGAREPVILGSITPGDRP